MTTTAQRARQSVWEYYYRTLQGHMRPLQYMVHGVWVGPLPGPTVRAFADGGCLLAITVQRSRPVYVWPALDIPYCKRRVECTPASVCYSRDGLVPGFAGKAVGRWWWLVMVAALVPSFGV